MKELYAAADKKAQQAKKAAEAAKDGRAYESESAPTKQPDWLQIQEWAFIDDEIQEYGDASTAFAKIKTLVLEAQRKSVKLPIIRKATEDVTIRKPDGTSFDIKKGKTIICDLVSLEWRGDVGEMMLTRDLEPGEATKGREQRIGKLPQNQN